MYQALYRKWRPMTFSDVVGQRHVTDTLRTQVRTNRLSHAYLFTGTRGTGKTTCAKILAKAANCLNPVEGEPCNECSSCVGINNESVTDVSEIDAASYTGVDNIRAIRDESAYSPAEAKMRVYIIDECHMLSTGANNALLKTLEEPPSHVLFILATTELNKVPETILSRCQLFTFKRLQQEDISTRLKEIAAAEKIPLDENAADLLARLADGALRDAISMLDQCAMSSTGVIGVEQVRSIIGLSTTVEILRLAKALGDGDSGTALRILSEMYSEGKDLASVLSELTMLLRDVLILKTTNNSKLLLGNYNEEDIEKIDIGRLRLMQMINTIQETLSAMKWSSNRRIDAELCLIKLSDETLAEGIDGLQVRVERLEDGFNSLRRVQANAPNVVQNAMPNATSEATARAVGSVSSAGSVNGTVDIDDDVPWEIDEPSKPERHKAEVPISDGVAAKGRSTVKSAEATKADQSEATTSAPAQVNVSDMWGKVVQRMKSEIPVSEFSFLKSINTPVLQGSRLRIITDAPITKNILNKPEILNIINKEASIILGKDIKADVVGTDRLNYEQTKLGTDDNLQKLIDRQDKYGNIKVDNR